jgi:predicted MFS family arabinose efflux permease
LINKQLTLFAAFMGGVIVTYKSWRAIFYLQTGLGGLGTALMLSPLLPETIHNFTKATEMSALSRGAYFRELASLVNPMRVLRLFLYPNIICVGLASSALSWNMYSLLTPITHVLNPRFGLSSPIQSALFYLAPGVGYIVGTLVGGRWADRVVIKNIKKRNGERVAEDRLKSCLVALGIVIPASMLIYGWSVEKEFGGIPLPVIMMFSQAVAQLFVYPSINTYCLDVMQHKGWSAEVTAGNYLIRWMFAAAGSAACLPAIQKIGLGWFEVISAGFLVFSAVLVWACSVWGRDWRETAARKRVWAD